MNQFVPFNLMAGKASVAGTAVPGFRLLSLQEERLRYMNNIINPKIHSQSDRNQLLRFEKNSYNNNKNYIISKLQSC